MDRRTLVSSFLSLALLAASATTRAHHAFSAEFDAQKPLKLTGTVTKLEWQNPHTWFYIDVDDGNGGIVNWGMELASPNLLMRNGWTQSSMKIGDVVTVEGFHAKTGAKVGNARVVTLTASGQRLFAGPTAARSAQ
jgi:Family of unknown function (DUF6152)